MKRMGYFLSLLILPWIANCQTVANPTAAAKSTGGDDGDSVRLTDNTIIFYYEAFADLPSPLETVARSYSPDYRNAATEFARVDLMKQLTPVLQRKIETARSSKDVVVMIRCQIPSYDFARKGFETTILSSSFVPYDLDGASYAVAFKGTKEFGFLSIAQDQAAQFQAKLARSRSGYVQVYATPVSAEDQNLDGRSRKTLFVKVRRLVLCMDEGTVIGEINATSTK